MDQEFELEFERLSSRQFPIYGGTLTPTEYFNKRKQEIFNSQTTRIVDEYDPDNLHSWQKPQAQSVFKLAATETTFDCAVKCFGDGIFVEALSDSFSKLMLTIFRNYLEWAKRVLKKWPVKIMYDDYGKNAFETMEVNMREALASLSSDFQALIRYLPYLEGYVVYKTQNLPDVNQSTARVNIQIAIHELMKLKPLVKEAIAAEAKAFEVSRRGIEHLKHVKDIPQLFIDKNKKAPTEASPYVLAIFEEPRAFLKSCSDSWAARLYTYITKSYLQAVKELMDSVQYPEVEIISTVCTVPPITDEEKIKVQISLDLITYYNEMDKEKVSRSEVPDLRALEKLVLPTVRKYRLLVRKK